MTEHEQTLLDATIADLNHRIVRYETLRKEIAALERRGSKELAFFAGRRSMARELKESGGLPESRLGLEILYLLPDEFVEFYSMLFHRAFSVGDSSVMHGRSGGVERAKGRTGIAAEHTDKGGEGTRGPQATGSGKKFKNTGLVIGNERMLKLKSSMDGKIIQAMRETKIQMDEGVEGVEGLKVKPVSDLPGTLRCSACMAFVSKTHRFCPMCGVKLGEASGEKQNGTEME